MNRITTFALSAILLGGITIFLLPEQKPQVFEEGQVEEEKSTEGPYKYFHFQRSYPDNVFDHKAYRYALKQVHHDMLAAGSVKSGLQSNWRLEGPTNIGGRINCIEVHPTNPNIIYTGSASGGIFKTTNGGTTWVPIADTLAQLAISDITINPKNTQIIYAATGDHNISGTPMIGDGVYKSTDGGQTWKQTGLINECIISKIIIHPTNTDTIYAAAMGRPMVKNANRGLYRSTDGGATWSKIHFISNQAGVVDVMMDPFNPSTLYCAGWDRYRTNTTSIAAGNGARIWKSTDNGNNWSMLTNGLPSYKCSRIGLAASQKTPNLIFACIVDSTYNLEGIYKSANAGASWSKLGTTGLDMNFLGGFGWYFAQIRVSPYNDNQISVTGVEMQSTTNGGASWFRSVPKWSTYQVHADGHDMVYVDSTTILYATDGGLFKTTNNMSSWSDADEIPNTQLYRVTVNPYVSGVYTGGAQDNGTSSGNYTSLNTWPREFGGDGFQPMYDPTNPSIRYFETQNGGLYFYDGSNYYYFDTGINPNDRTNWDQPIMLGRNHPNTALTGTFRMWRMKGGAPWGTWDSVSNDLTDGNIYGSAFHNISAVEESPVDSNYLYAGTSDGNVWVSLNKGTTWTKVSASLPDRYVTRVIASPTNKSKMYVTHSGYKYNDFTPHIHRSDNNGSTWTSVSGNLPPMAINDLVVYNGRSDSVMIIACDGGVYATTDAGNYWERVGGNMPAIPVFDLEIDYTNKRLVAGTFARSIQSFPLDSILGFKPVFTGIAQQNSPQFKFYPSPVQQTLHISGINMTDNTYTIRVFDLRGSMVKETRKPISGVMELNVSDLRRGTYLLNISSGEFSYTEKFIKM